MMLLLATQKTKDESGANLDPRKGTRINDHTTLLLRTITELSSQLGRAQLELQNTTVDDRKQTRVTGARRGKSCTTKAQMMAFSFGFSTN